MAFDLANIECIGNDAILFLYFYLCRHQIKWNQMKGLCQALVTTFIQVIVQIKSEDRETAETSVHMWLNHCLE